MKQITVSDKAAKLIEHLRDSKIGTFEGELEGLLDALHGLNLMICYSKDSEEVAQFANEIHQAEDQILSYYHLMKLLVYECDAREDGRVEVKTMEQA